MSDDAAVLEAAKKLPLGEQLAHSSWKVRAQGLATVQERVGRAFSTDDDIFAEAGAPGGGRGMPRLQHAAARRRHRHPLSPSRAPQAHCWPRRRATRMPM